MWSCFAYILVVVAAISWLVPGCSPWWLPNPGWFQDAGGNRAGYCRGGRRICNGRKLKLVTNTDQWVMGFIRKARYKNAHNVMGSVKARYQSWSVGPRTWPVHRDIGDAGWKQVSPLIERKQTRVEIDSSHFVETVQTQVHGTRLWC
jgi:hypothetical protein